MMWSLGLRRCLPNAISHHPRSCQRTNEMPRDDPQEKPFLGRIWIKGLGVEVDLLQKISMSAKIALKKRSEDLNCSDFIFLICSPDPCSIVVHQEDR